MDASQNGEQVSTNLLGGTKVNSHPQDAELNSEFTRSMNSSDNYVHDSHNQVQTSFDNSGDNAEMQTYILSVGTVKRDLAGVSKSTQSQASHKRLIDESLKVIDGIDCLSILVDHHIEHEVLLHDGFSQTQQWGPIHNFYVKVIGSESIANGVAALLGTMFKQYAIGIYHPLTKDDRQILDSNQGQPLPDNFHQYFTVYSASPISDDTTLKITGNVCERFPDLSGQLDTSGQSIEFHDFDSVFKGTSAQIEEALKENFQQVFRVKTQFAKSTVLEKYHYQQALNTSGLQISRIVD
jgi:hypothetical protein